MPRNSQGLYQLPAGNPVIPNTLIESEWANTTMNDIAEAMTNSLPRDGSASMTGQLSLNSSSPTKPLHATSKAYVDQFMAYATGMPIATVFSFAGVVVLNPSGYLICDGSAVSRTTYSDLFTAIGTTFGSGDGVSTFNIPNLKDQFIRGKSDSRALGSTQTGAFAAHTHPLVDGSHIHVLDNPPHTHIDGGHTHTITDPGHTHSELRASTTSSQFAPDVGAYNGGGSTLKTQTGITVNSGKANLQSASQLTNMAYAFSNISMGATGDTETRPQNIALVYYIKAANDTGATVSSVQTVVSADANMLSVDSTDPQNLILTPIANVAFATVKLDGNGKVPSGLLPTSAQSFIGLFDASTGNNPSQEFPTQSFTSGDTYLVSVAGTILVYDPVTYVESMAAVALNSNLLYLNNSIDPAGWYYVATSTAPVPGPGMVKSNGVSLQTAVAGTDYVAPNTPSTQLTFTQVGAGAVSRTVQAKNADVVHVKDFGAIGDGVADDTAKIQAAIASGNIVEFGGSENTYKITAMLDVSAGNKTLHGSGAAINFAAIGGSPKTAIGNTTVVPSSGTAITGATKGTYTVSCANTTSLAADDYVLVTSNDIYQYEDGSYQVKKGEVLKIRSISPNVSVTFTTPLNDTYSTTPMVRTVPWVNNIKVSGIKLVGPDAADAGANGINLNYVKGFSIEGCTINGADFYNIGVTSCILGRIVDNDITGVFYDGVTGSIFYGIAVLNSSSWVQVSGNTGDRLRHLVVTTASTATYGQPRYVVASDNHAFDSMGGGAGESFAYEVHGFGDSLVFDSNTADGCYAGLRLENGSNVVVSNNLFTNYSSAGIVVGDKTKLMSNVLITGNIVDKCARNVASPATVCGLRIEAGTATITNLTVSDNTFSKTWSTFSGSGGGANIAANTYANCSLINNRFESGLVGANTNGITIASGASNWLISGNSIYDYRGGINISGNDCSIKGNRSVVSAVQATGFALYSNGARNVFQGNSAKAAASAFRADTLSSNNLFINNQAVQCTASTFSNAGAGNVGRDNDVVA